MEQRHMQEKSRGAARPDVDARARAIQEQIIHIPRPAQPGNARPAAQSTADTLRAHSSVLLKRHAPGMTLAPSGGAQRPLRHTQRPAGRLRADATMPQSRANAGARQAAVCSLPVWPLLS